MVALGFKVQDNEELRNRILDNEHCQATAIYHLLLDRTVQDEMEQLKLQFMQNPGKIHHRNSVSQQPEDEEMMEDTSPRSIEEEEPTPMEKSNISPTPSFTLSKPKIDTQKAAEKAGIIETRSRAGSDAPRRVLAGPVNAIVSPRKMASIMEDEEEGSSSEKRKPHSDTAVPYSSNTGQSSITFSIPQHSAHIMSYSSPSAVTPLAKTPVSTPVVTPIPTNKLPPRPAPREQSPRGGNAQQTSPRSALAPPPARGRRSSICGPPTSAPQPQRVSPPKKMPPSQLRTSTVLPSPAPPPTVSGRRFSLDARVAAANQTSPRGRYEDTTSAGVPRAVRGVFKSSTTTTKTPEQAAKIVKKTLEGGGFFTKKRSPYLFQVIDDQTNVTFEVEVCFISPLQMTGIHLKRISGDVWKYKTLATDLVNHMHL
eukprot:TRINITY_DN1482_c0_g3_i1.p1 TRINITY_DN1482_c0_g3~~TRINITY_DN1482_c0_g3_i1.p1  ORF type:complete len:450 (-),score=93.96 TRINITY_DN1482_c0_g3_i1:357-1631(-)